MARIHQNSHPILSQESVALPYAGFLLRNQIFSRSLLILYPVVKRQKYLRPAYEWVQRLYSHSDREDGKVAIKNPQNPTNTGIQHNIFTISLSVGLLSCRLVKSNQ